MNNKIAYPHVHPDWSIKGSKANPRFVNWRTGKVIPLKTYDIFSLISYCDGTNSIEDIHQLTSQVYPIQGIREFYNKFHREGVLTYESKPCRYGLKVTLCDQEPWLREVHMDITGNCNLRCVHCFWGENLASLSDCDISCWKKLIHDMDQAGVARAVVSGGESLTSSNFEQIIKSIIDSRIFLAAIFTNGTIWNSMLENVLERICSEQIETAFYISLDGINAQQHDYIRGCGNFEITNGFIKKLIAYREQHNGQYKIVVNSLIHLNNYCGLIEWYNYLESIKVDRWRVTAGRNVGNFKTNYATLKVPPKLLAEQYVALIHYLVDHYQSQNRIMSMNVENFFTAHCKMKMSIEEK